MASPPKKPPEQPSEAPLEQEVKAIEAELDTYITQVIHLMPKERQQPEQAKAKARTRRSAEPQMRRDESAQQDTPQDSDGNPAE